MIRDEALFATLLDTVSRFVREVLVPIEERLAREDAVPASVVEQMRALGLFGLTIPEEFGGLGLTVEEEVEVVLVLGRTSPAFRSVFGTNIGIGSRSLILTGTDEQKSRYLPRLASGDLIASFALTEPEAGSDAASLRSQARLDGEEWLLNGTKRFITNASHAGLFTVFARTGGEGADGISAFLVEPNAPGFSLGRPERKMGQQGAPVCDVVLENCRVPRANILGEPGKGFATAMRTLDRGRVHIAALCVGIAERLIGDMARYARERRQFGRPIADFQLIQAMIADSQAEAFAARCMVVETAKRADAGVTMGRDASCCKLFASEMVGRVADRAVQVHGGAGYIGDYGVERFYRDVRLFRLYEGTSQIQQLIIARHVLAEAAA
ncbi:acyl-CoA dehydrogenase family protein [Bosea sp. (in: a-proteobacteria)]|uniref:acyl-CoA dehydrogenase family protein n=1 Tax=Bosea sp. (in: a-proteobacteria) TaxID=1871050 RepID=UPI0025B7EE7B|nr:acyl-CoA dehydrogenase family protein [Bosea sp. (in: a-proteobacteria)]MBR3192818.1 acyl-CoA dehydrogenase family protein [Bosea sp. (in: a-proteobacteria)]